IAGDVLDQDGCLPARSPPSQGEEGQEDQEGEGAPPGAESKHHRTTPFPPAGRATGDAASFAWGAPLSCRPFPGWRSSPGLSPRGREPPPPSAASCRYLTTTLTRSEERRVGKGGGCR